MIARFNVAVSGLPVDDLQASQRAIEEALAASFHGRLRIDGKVEISDIQFELSRDELDIRPRGVQS